MLTFHSARFGTLKCEQKEIISFPRGLPGFDAVTAFVIVDPHSADLFLWLQSIKYPELAFPIVETSWFSLDYQIGVSPEQGEVIKRDLMVEDFTKLTQYGVVTVPADKTKMTINLRAPLLINTREGVGMHFIISEENVSYGIREPLYLGLKGALMGGFRKGENLPQRNDSIVVVHTSD